MSKFLLITSSIFVFFISVQRATAASRTCNPKLITKYQKLVYLNVKQDTYWISVSDTSSEFFSSLGYKNIPKIKANDLAGKEIGNIVNCSNTTDFQKVYSHFTGTRTLSFLVNNSCQEKFVKRLGFELSEIENHGSMESGTLMHLNGIGLCVDGGKLFHCDTTKEMQNCFLQTFGAKKI